MSSSDTRHIYQSLFVNVAITVAKGIAAVMTGSGAMLAETLHTTADCGNQILLLLGVKQTQRPPDRAHPMGYGRALYFWSFMVALLLFTGGGVFSMYEGIHKLSHEEPVENVGLAVGILVFSLLLEGGSTISNVREMRSRSGGKPLLRYLRETKDSDLIVVFGENAAASVGLILALGAIGMTVATGDVRWDAYGTIAIGVVLIGVAVFLATEVKSLLVGESADAGIIAAVEQLVAEDPQIHALNSLITVQQGPGEVMVAMKLRFEPTMSAVEVAVLINTFEDRLRSRCPEVRWSFVEPGLEGET
jgi:cation diffusion facilitator family transporter